jgi:hypothetical protein
MKVWLDDERPAPGGWVHVKSDFETIEFLCRKENRGNVTHLSLDHDLGAEEFGTGYDVVLVLEDLAANDMWKAIPEKITVHSANPVGRAKMEAGIRSIEKMRKKFVEGVDR